MQPRSVQDIKMISDRRSVRDLKNDIVTYCGIRPGVIRFHIAEIDTFPVVFLSLPVRDLISSVPVVKVKFSCS